MLHTQKLEGLGVLAGGIAHDFNNLLVSMLGNAELARTELDHDSPVQPYLVDVEAATDRARELTSQLLAYTGKGKFVLETLDLSELVRSVTELLSVSIPKKVEGTEDDGTGPTPKPLAPYAGRFPQLNRLSASVTGVSQAYRWREALRRKIRQRFLKFTHDYEVATLVEGGVRANDVYLGVGF